MTDGRTKMLYVAEGIYLGLSHEQIENFTNFLNTFYFFVF